MVKNKINIKIEIKAFHPYYLNKLIIVLYKYLMNFPFLIKNKKIISLPKKTERFTVLRSPHVDKKARDQFERITFKKIFVMELVNGYEKEIFNIMRILQLLIKQNSGVLVKINYSV